MKIFKATHVCVFVGSLDELAVGRGRGAHAGCARLVHGRSCAAAPGAPRGWAGPSVGPLATASPAAPDRLAELELGCGMLPFVRRVLGDLAAVYLWLGLTAVGLVPALVAG